VTSAPLRELVPAVMLTATGVFLGRALRTGSPACPFAGFTFLTASPLHSWWHTLVQDFLPACHRLRLQRPRLRSRLTLGRLTLPRNPQAFGVCGSYTDDATHSGIRTSVRSTSLRSLASARTQRSPTIPVAGLGSRASVRCFSLATLSVPAHSTSELLRTLSMMAASKPTSWLFGRTNRL
jgi:hypothetical protein